MTQRHAVRSSKVDRFLVAVSFDFRNVFLKPCSLLCNMLPYTWTKKFRPLFVHVLGLLLLLECAQQSTQRRRIHARPIV
ncbi:hypothetical protein CBM2587_B60334 [Cupriavidus taiwanensis]|uniref:Uncharacterized protein n=1 Tax=Cupriavidus taiwanensis TaxID=164546 RepID=A0A975XAI9_9BURK|nr:hypothetical protein CBM2587_B60334 [Cupriavidus taiwanensis]